MSRLLKLLLLLAPLWLVGCDLLGIEGASAVQARREAEGKAVGGACRHAGRAIEDCYALNKKADKAAVFAGWREMNDYMTENKIEVVLPRGSGEAAVAAHDAEAEDEADAAPKKGAKGGHKDG
jgi:hypothetical protein